MTTVLEISNLDLTLGQRDKTVPVLRDIHLRVSRGQVHGLVGVSGAGKSMLGKAILGLLPGKAAITKGSIYFGDVDLTFLDRQRRRHLASRHLAMIPQDPMTSLNPVRKVGKQICDVLKLHLNLNSKQALNRSLELLHEVQINEPMRVVDQYPFELSGGMRQRILIAMAFSCKPELIIADEPTTALDVTVQRQILQLIKQLQSDSGTALLFITHDLGVIAKICDSVSVMHEGSIVEQRDVLDLFENPQHSYTRSLLRTASQYYQYDPRMTSVT